MAIKEFRRRMNDYNDTELYGLCRYGDMKVLSQRRVRPPACATSLTAFKSVTKHHRIRRRLVTPYACCL